MFVLLGVCIAATVIAGIFVLTGIGGHDSRGNDLIVLAGLVFVAAFWILPALATRREKAEVQSGYTTIRSRYIEVEQRSPRTGAVIRSPGQPFLSPAEFRRIVLSEADLDR